MSKNKPTRAVFTNPTRGEALVSDVVSAPPTLVKASGAPVVALEIVEATANVPSFVGT